VSRVRLRLDLLSLGESGGHQYEADDWEVDNKHRQTYAKLVITLEDMQRSSAEFSIDVLNIDAGFRRGTD
jgi:hypothetical protein